MSNALNPFGLMMGLRCPPDSAMGSIRANGVT